MRKIDQYHRGIEFCLENAGKALFSELRAVWQTLGSSYAFLAELESWPGFGVGSGPGNRNGNGSGNSLGNTLGNGDGGGDGAVPAAPRLNGRPACDPSPASGGEEASTVCPSPALTHS